MPKIVYINAQKEAAEDLEAALLLDARKDFELHCFYNLKDVEKEAAELKPDRIIISYNALSKKDTWDFGDIPVAFHAGNQKELEAGAAYGYPTVGIAKSLDEILRCLDKAPYDPHEKNTGIPARKQKKAQPAKPNKIPKKEEPARKPDYHAEEVQEPEEDEFDGYGDYDDALLEELDEEIPEDNEEPDGTPHETDILTDGKEKVPGPRPHAEKPGRAKIQKEQKKDIIREEFLKDSGQSGPVTKVITVYSAKGGVGKTTVASELATYLSLVSVGRKKLRVCIVDYNIDFGDVSATIHIDPKTTLTDWADEVQELMEKGRAPEDIVYSREEIESWLEVDKRSGLYVLSAPVTNEDSMGIESDSLAIILDNIIKHGEFDYVVCDTGNNTRDSTMIALEKATMILLIMTQNLNTANCDKAFMETMDSIDFDLSHAKLVVNNIMPYKATNISVQEIMEAFPFECVGKLKFNTDVIIAGNRGEPLAFQPGHEFTKQLRSLVSYILQEGDFDSRVTVQKKKTLFGFLRKKKG